MLRIFDPLGRPESPNLPHCSSGAWACQVTGSSMNQIIKYLHELALTCVMGPKGSKIPDCYNPWKARFSLLGRLFAVLPACWRTGRFCSVPGRSGVDFGAIWGLPDRPGAPQTSILDLKTSLFLRFAAVPIHARRNSPDIDKTPIKPIRNACRSLRASMQKP